MELALKHGKIKQCISDHGSQFVSNLTDGNSRFVNYLRRKEIKQILCRIKHPQSNGKIERWHQSLKQECIRPKTPLSLEDARRIVDEFVTYYNNKRLHSAIGYIAPKDKLEGRSDIIFEKRARKLSEARKRRKNRGEELR